MAIDYANLRDETVQPLLKDLGFEMTLVSSREPVIDPNTGAVTAEGANVSTTVVGIFRFFSQDEIRTAEGVGYNILANDSQALIDAKALNTAGIEPDTVKQLIANGVTYNVVRNWPVQPGGVPLLYRLQVRR